MNIIKLINIAVFLSTAATTCTAAKLYDSVTFDGFGALQMGQLVRGYYNAPYSQISENHGNHLISHQWIESLRSRFIGTFYKGPSIKLNFGLDFNYDFFTINNPGPNPDNVKALTPLTYYPDLLIHRADLEYNFLSNEKSSLDFQLGYFPFKYNPQAQNLGEYLFRSGAYPNFIVNEFYFAETRLLGANLSGAVKGESANLRGNLLLTSEMTYPVQDFSLAGLVNTDLFNNAIELGGGLQFQRLIPVDPKRTTPKTQRNSITDSSSTDTSYYTYSGTKAMARLCFDVKKIIPMVSILGDEDLKIYGECAILGLKNYGTYYKNISERMPLMFGFDFPAFKLLDVLALEFEYYTNPYFNNNRNQIYPDVDNYSPAVPYVFTSQANDIDGGHGVTSVKDHRWKWSLFARKKIGQNFQIVAQAARDHSRFQDPMNHQTYYTYDGDVTISAKDWYYLLRLEWQF